MTSVRIVWIPIAALMLSCGVAGAQIPMETARLLDKDTLMMIDVKNTRQLLKEAKSKFYDLVYRSDVSQKRLLPLNLAVFDSLRKPGGTPLRPSERLNRHWLIESLKAICSKSSRLGQELENALQPLSDVKTAPDFSEREEEEVIEM